MKKFLAILLTLVLCVSLLAACGEKETPGGSEPNDPGGNGDQPGNSNTQPETPEDTQPEEPEDTRPEAPSGPVTITVADYLSQDVWEDDGGFVTVSADGIVFDNALYGDLAALRLKEEAADATWKFNLQLTDIAEGLSEDAGDWWDSELCIVVRSAVAGSGYASGEQTGYTVTCWGDMSTVYLGRSGYDDAFGGFPWPCGDGQPHDIEITATNNADKTAVTVKLVVDGQVIAEVTDDGSLVKEGRTNLFPDAGGLTIRCKYLGATVK